MAKAFIQESTLTDIADAIRAKLGVVDTYLPSEMADAILSIPKRKVVDFNVSPITLNGAMANSLQYVKAYGKCEQNGTPTPTTPVDIVCNNGILKVDGNGNVYTQGNQETLQLGTDTATCERLLSLNGYTDTQEILSGVVNRKIGIKVLDGTEDWSTQTGTHPYVYHNFYDGIITDPNYVLNEKITHFECVPITLTTNNQGVIVATRVNRYTAVFLRYDNLFDPTTTSGRNTLKTFLQTQYNNGTPVIIIYPLATPTTESVTEQTLQVEAGDNTLEITQSSLPNLEVECEYFLQ